MNPKNIVNFNKYMKFHGYQEWYNIYGISYRGYRKNDMEIGYEEYHPIKETNFYIR